MFQVIDVKIEGGEETSDSGEELVAPTTRVDLSEASSLNVERMLSYCCGVQK